MHHDYKTQMTCSQMISFDLNGDVVSNISFLGGCNGNLKAISKLACGRLDGGKDRIVSVGQPVRAPAHLLRRPAGEGGATGL